MGGAQERAADSLDGSDTCDKVRANNDPLSGKRKNQGLPHQPEIRHLSVYDGRRPIGTIHGAARHWHAIDAFGCSLPGAPFESQRDALAALNAARPDCTADARFDGT
jgi:hypothetical protein